MNKTFVFQNVRLLYPAIIRPKEKFGGNGEEYSFVMLVPKKDKVQLKRFHDLYTSMVKEEFGSKPAGIRPAIGLPMEKAVLKDGDNKYNSVDVDKRPNYEAYQDCYYANMSIDATVGKIEAIDLDRQPILQQDQIPSGAYAHVVAECSCYKSQKWGPQFSVRPILVQVTDISDPLGVPRMSAEDAAKLLPGYSDSEDDAPWM
jgi:hypothetical protein